MTAELESPAHGPQGIPGPPGPAGPPGPQGPNALALLADVDLTDVGDGQALVYVAAQLAGGRPWRPVDVAEQDELDVVAAAVAVLEAAMPTKAADAGVVHLAGAENVAGAKNFTGGLTLAGAAVETVAGSQAKADAAVAYADATFLPLAQRGAPGGVPTLDGASLIPNAFLPPLAITDRFPVASQAEMLALAAETGDIAVRTDQRRTYMLRGDPAVLGNWQELLSPLDTVTSVNAQVGVVQLTAADIPYAATTVEAQLDAIAADPRWADPRTPTGPAGGVLAGNYPNPGFAAAPALVGLVSVLTGGDNTVGLSVRRTNATQVSPLTEWRDETGAAMTAVDAAGVLTRLASGSYLFNSATSPSNKLVAAAAGTVPLALQAAASQTANILNLLDSAGSVLSFFSSGGRLTIGRTTGSSNMLNVYGASTAVARFTNTTASSTSGGAGMIGAIQADPTAVDHRLGFLLFGSEASGAFAGMNGYAAEAWGANARGTYLTWDTTAVGAASRSERMRLTDAGQLGVNFTAPGATVGLRPLSTSAVGLILKNLASQTGDILQVLDSAGAIVARIAASGAVRSDNFLAIAGSKASIAMNADTGGILLATGADGNKGLVLRRNSSSQTANLFELQNETGVLLTNADSVGRWGIRTASTSASLTVTPTAATNIAVIPKGFASQSADILQAQDSTGAALHAITAAGLPKWAAAATVQTTVGAAGGAAAPPATPTKWLKVVDNAGTTLVVPAYAAA